MAGTEIPSTPADGNMLVLDVPAARLAVLPAGGGDRAEAELASNIYADHLTR